LDGLVHVPSSVLQTLSVHGSPSSQNSSAVQQPENSGWTRLEQDRRVADILCARVSVIALFVGCATTRDFSMGASPVHRVADIRCARVFVVAKFIGNAAQLRATSKTGPQGHSITIHAALQDEQVIRVHGLNETVAIRHAMVRMPASTCFS
jgi:hypothetical protein